MTREAIQAITKELKQYQSPALNDKLYLHFKGWKKIEECLGEYNGVKALWLEGNGLRTLENLGNLKQLRCLYIQQNCLESLGPSPRMNRARSNLNVLPLCCLCVHDRPRARCSRAPT